MTKTDLGPYVTYESDGAVARIVLNDPSEPAATTRSRWSS